MNGLQSNLKQGLISMQFCIFQQHAAYTFSSAFHFLYCSAMHKDGKVKYIYSINLSH